MLRPYSTVTGLLALWSMIFSINPCHAAVVRPYVDPHQQTSVWFGAYSHYAQPWRAYLETPPAAVFLEGTGINYNAQGNPDLVVRMLASHGIHHLRIEIGWGDVSYDHPDQLNNAASLAALLAAAKHYGCRPLILLNAHQGVPCPVRFFSRKVVDTAPAGSRTVHLDDVTGLRVGYSGLSQLTDYWAAEAMITAIDPGTGVVTLSKPLPKPIPAGKSVPMATLKYRPFEPPTLPNGAPNPIYAETMTGWDQYLLTVARFVTHALNEAGPTSPEYAALWPHPTAGDAGFDMEVWNELTFGDHYLYINDYYSPPLFPKYDGNKIWGLLVAETARVVRDNPAVFKGTLVGDGFANTIPWPASSTEPPGITAIDKHPYAGRKTFPEEKSKGTALDALLQPDSSGWVPSYTELFPEYFASAIQTETMIREMSPIATPIGKTMHGRYARLIDGKVSPVTTWITEVNIGPVEDNPKITAAEALAIKAKTTARYFTFYLNKGVTQLDLFAAAGGDKDLGIVQDNFLKLAAKPGAAYPADDRPYTSDALRITAAIIRKMREGIDFGLTSAELHPLSLISVRDSGGIQFAGSAEATSGEPATTGTTAGGGMPKTPNPHPPLHDADVFAFLPFQVNATRYAVPYYLVTRDVAHVYHPVAVGPARYECPPEMFTMAIGGTPGRTTRITAYDPLHDRVLPVKIVARNRDGVTVRAPAVDYPYLLLIDRRP